MKFTTGVPGVLLYPPSLGNPDSQGRRPGKWQASMKTEDFVRVAQKADELGYDYLAFAEHIVMPYEMLEVMGPRWNEAMTMMSFFAGATKRIRVVSSVLVLPYRHPVLLAKSLATLDLLSGGRVTVNIGAGHLQREFEILGIPYHERGAMTNEYIMAMKELWTNEKPSFQGKYVQFDKIIFDPKPTQKPHVPIWVGGNSRAALRRAANLGDGWNPWLITHEQLPECLEYIREQPGYQKRTQPFDVYQHLTISKVEDYSHRELGPHEYLQSKDQIIDQIGMLQDIGVTVTGMAQLGPAASLEQYLEQMEWYAREVMPVFKR